MRPMNLEMLAATLRQRGLAVTIPSPRPPRGVSPTSIFCSVSAEEHGQMAILPNPYVRVRVRDGKAMVTVVDGYRPEKTRVFATSDQFAEGIETCLRSRP